MFDDKIMCNNVSVKQVNSVKSMRRVGPYDMRLLTIFHQNTIYYVDYSINIQRNTCANNKYYIVIIGRCNEQYNIILYDYDNKQEVWKQSATK